MKIRTYENSVQHGVIDTLKREDLVRDLSSRAQDAQRIITAPALSGRQDAEANESAEAAAAANAEKRAKSLAGAFREFAGNEGQASVEKGSWTRKGNFRRVWGSRLGGESHGRRETNRRSRAGKAGNCPWLSFRRSGTKGCGYVRAQHGKDRCARCTRCHA